MSRYIDQGLRALEIRDTSSALQAFERAALVADSADLGAPVRLGVRRNLARAYRNAGRLKEAEAAYRQILNSPDLPADQRPFILHGLGYTLALSGSPEAKEMLACAADSYSLREDVLSASLDLAEIRAEAGATEQGYTELSRLLTVDDRTAYPDLFCQAHLVLARLMLLERNTNQARDHLEAASEVLNEGGAPVLHALRLALVAELTYLNGDAASAKSLASEALELALVHAELHSSNVLRKTAELFLRIHRA